MQTTKVGDRYVLERMLEGGYNLGGEQSGHIIFLDEANTGDGQLSGAKVLEILAESGLKMSELASVMEHFPQVMINVKISPRNREVWKNDSQITDLIEMYENELGDGGRILVRESGTEPLITWERYLRISCRTMLRKFFCRSISANSAADVIIALEKAKCYVLTTKSLGL